GIQTVLASLRFEESRPNIELNFIAEFLGTNEVDYNFPVPDPIPPDFYRYEAYTIPSYYTAETEEMANGALLSQPTPTRNVSKLRLPVLAYEQSAIIVVDFSPDTNASALQTLDRNNRRQATIVICARNCPNPADIYKNDLVIMTTDAK